jgi:NAD(P)-dependent dehydrogenase (short-subunit alcohol dehydrogenase family)
LITGCSTGIGRALAETVVERGYNAIITARDISTVRSIAVGHPKSALVEALDVTDSSRIREVVQHAEEQFGGIDVLVNNAGYGYRAATEEAPDEDVQRLFSTNFMGPVHLIRAVLPGMRARRSGTIFNVSSIGVRLMMAGGGYYAASKAALEAMTGSLRKEVGPLGIRAITVEPGGFRTDFAGRSLQQSPTAIDDYANTAGLRRKENEHAHGTQPGDPRLAAAALIRVAESQDPPGLLLLGQDALAEFALRRATDDADVTAWRDVSASTDFETQSSKDHAAV